MLRGKKEAMNLKRRGILEALNEEKKGEIF